MEGNNIKIIDEKQKEAFENLKADKNLNQEDILFILATADIAHTPVERKTESVTKRLKRTSAIAESLFNRMKCYDLTVYEALEVTENLNNLIQSRTKIQN